MMLKLWQRLESEVSLTLRFSSNATTGMSRVAAELVIAPRVEGGDDTYMSLMAVLGNTEMYIHCRC